MAKIAFIGLGNMGLPMAQNLAAARHDLQGFDASIKMIKAAKAAGIPTCTSTIEAVADADIVFMMLPHGKAALSVSEAILPILKPQSLLIDCSTIDVQTAELIHEKAKAAKVYCLDAPVSGGIGGAAAGTLTFMVGGEDEAFEVAKPLLDIMGKKSVHCGAGGAGQAAKICNNMLLAISMIGSCEAFNLGEKLGLKPSVLFDVMSTSSGSCWSVNTYCPVPNVGPQSPADNDYKAGFSAAMMAKDTSLAQQAARHVSASTPLGEHADALYAKMLEEGLGHEDFSAMIKFLAKDNAQ